MGHHASRSDPVEASDGRVTTSRGARSFTRVRDGGHRCSQLIDVERLPDDRLDHDRIEAGQGRRSRCRADDDRNGIRGRAQERDDFVPADFRHHHVENHRGIPFLSKQADRLSAVRCDFARVATPPEDRAQEVLRRFVIVDDEDRKAVRFCRHVRRKTAARSHKRGAFSIRRRSKEAKPPARVAASPERTTLRSVAGRLEEACSAQEMLYRAASPTRRCRWSGSVQRARRASGFPIRRLRFAHA